MASQATRERLSQSDSGAFGSKQLAGVHRLQRPRAGLRHGTDDVKTIGIDDTQQDLVLLHARARREADLGDHAVERREDRDCAVP